VSTRQSVQLGLGSQVDELVATAIGEAHRSDPVRPHTGGPAGNARLTAWLGAALLLLFLAEAFTLVSLHRFIDVHILLGGVLVPLTIAKTATTGWRIARYYSRSPDYVEAGPPPLVLRVLGPLVILTALAVLGTGIALVAVGAGGAFHTLFSVAGFRVSPLTLHQAAFAAWLAVTALHVLARTVPALKVMAGRADRAPVPGKGLRVIVLVGAVALAVVCGVVLLHVSGSWTHQHGFHGFPFGHGKRLIPPGH